MIQETLQFTPPSRSYHMEDFLPAPANMLAWKAINNWPNWTSRSLNIYGETGSGKTHIAHIWAQLANAQFLNQADLTSKTSDKLLEHGNTWVLDDLDNILSNETAYFHLLNKISEKNDWLLLCSQQPLSQIAIKTADLASRLNAINHIELKNPDDLLLEAVLTKHFSDYQLKASPAAIKFILTHTERSFSAAKIVVEKLDLLSLQEKRAITLPLLQKLFKN